MLYEIHSYNTFIPVDGNSYMGAYVSHPRSVNSIAAIIIGMELFGVTRYIRNVTERVASMGYLAIAPDFYHRSQAGVELSYDQAGRNRGFELLHQISRNAALQDVKSTMQYLRGSSECNGKIGFLGLSVGGHIGYLAATQLDIAVCSIFYAGWLTTTDIELSQPEPTLALTSGIARQGGRILYSVGGKDTLVTSEHVDKIAQALTVSNVQHELVVYPEAQHGFFCDERNSYDPVASKDAWERTTRLFASMCY